MSNVCYLHIGQLVVRLVNGKRISGYIVETECYLGNVDAASHSFNNKQTKRTEPMFMAAGTSYVYTIYGMYYCFNISSKGWYCAYLVLLFINDDCCKCYFIYMQN